MPASSQPYLVLIPPSQVRRMDHGSASLFCPSCRSPLEFHQPSLESPLRLLGTCTRCECWQFISFNPEKTEAVIVTLPGHESLRDAAVPALSRSKLAPGDKVVRGRTPRNAEAVDPCGRNPATRTIPWC